MRYFLSSEEGFVSVFVHSVADDESYCEGSWEVRPGEDLFGTRYADLRVISDRDGVIDIDRVD